MPKDTTRMEKDVSILIRFSKDTKGKKERQLFKDACFNFKKKTGEKGITYKEALMIFSGKEL